MYWHTFEDEQPVHLLQAAQLDLAQRAGLLSENLTVLGIQESDIDQWIQPALSDPRTAGNPREISSDDVRALYRAAL